MDKYDLSPDDNYRTVELRLFDISVTPLTAIQMANVITQPGGRRLFLNHNMHSAYLHDVDESFRRLYNVADWIVVDGFPILWLAARYANWAIGPEYRIGSTDWIAALSELSIVRRLFVYGASEDSNRKAVGHLTEQLPGWTIAGIDGFVPPDIAIERISAFQPDIVIVGLGMPRQEHFLLEHLGDLPDAAYATVGGAIDYISGSTRLSPRWLGRFGLEWAWRLAHQPKRLAYRYLIEPVLLTSRVILRLMR